MESSSSNSSNSTGGDQGSFNPNHAPYSPPARQLVSGSSPLRRSGGAGQLRLAGASTPPPPRAIRPLATVASPMGLPGVSAFSPYNRPPPPPPSPPPRAGPTTGARGIPGFPAFTFYNRAPPRPDWYHGAGSSSGGSGLGLGCGFGFFGSHMAPGGASGSGGGHGGVASFEGGALRIDGSPAARKRGRDEGDAGSAGRQQGGYQVPCPICARDFMSDKALFGHMRSHPNRGWKGVHPPPAFRAEEEFADVPGLNRPEGMEAAAGGEGGAAAEGGGEADMQAQGAAEENYNVPDLNMPPPPSPDQ
ncbi:hypothetical protein F511_34686 [Dorcoceras hygrometricum]|uniref:C2H2-type domain-containing protein n=1 Tax=Dorcoceras hygrometricum TaxID=472368 RepID=A0A2Z7D3Y1_9LAMI|nr:hypothetical protein F511_34686 [Dorcoceras hygrometricum]